MKPETYTVKQPFPHKGRIVQPGEPVQLHPRQAKYLIGTHLEQPAAKPASKARGGAKSKEVESNA